MFTIRAASVEALVEAFGNYLFGRFFELFPVFFNHESSFAFLDTIHDVVHVEVLKLYPDATLPDFTSESRDDGKTLHFEYNTTIASLRRFGGRSHERCVCSLG